MLFNQPKQHLLLLLLACFGLSSCSPLIWPTSYQVPDLRNAGDAQVDVAAGVSAMNIQAAYSPVKHLALAATYNTDLYNDKNGHTYNHATFGGGYIIKTNGVAQLGALVKYGAGTSTDHTLRDNKAFYTQAKYRDYQFQPYVQFNVIDQYLMIYTGIRGSLIRIREFNNTDTSRMSPGNTGTFEPFFGIRGGFKYLKFEMQSGIYSHGNTYVDNGANKYFSIRTQDAIPNFNFSIIYNFNLHRGHFGINK